MTKYLCFTAEGDTCPWIYDTMEEAEARLNRLTTEKGFIAEIVIQRVGRCHRVLDWEPVQRGH